MSPTPLTAFLVYYPVINRRMAWIVEMLQLDVTAYGLQGCPFIKEIKGRGYYGGRKSHSRGSIVIHKGTVTSFAEVAPPPELTPYLTRLVLLQNLHST
jgi:hypothetical protein